MEIPTILTKKRRLKHVLTTLALLTGLATLPAAFQSSSGETNVQPPMPPLWNLLEDADQDGMTDVDELVLGMDPFNPEDGLSDLDGDDISLAWEFFIGTNPDMADTDMDGWSDSEEYLLYGTDPLDFLSFPQGDTVASDGDTTSATSIPEPEAVPSPPPSLSNGDFSDVSITTWKSMTNSTEYQGKGFVWNAGTVTSWSAYAGSTVEVWEAGGEKFVELDGSPGNYGIKQEIKNAKAGGYVLAWRESGRNSAKAGDDPYCVRVYYMDGVTEKQIGQSEFPKLDKSQWIDKAFAFQITPEQLAAAKGTPIYVAFIPTGSLNTYGTLIDKVSLLPVEVDLDVNGNGNLTDSCDGLKTYTPGYELDHQPNPAMLHTGDSFKNAQYSGPQKMRLIIQGLGSGKVDSATFKILNPSHLFGYCGNAKAKVGTSADDAIYSGADFSFQAEGDNFEIVGTAEADKIWAPIFCKDYGAWCEVEVTFKKNGTVIGNPIKLTLPRDDNGDKLADCWQDLEIDAWNKQFNPLPPRPVSDVGRDLVNPSLDDEESDSDGRNGDGGRNLNAMIWPNSTDLIEGDGLKVIEEYRGYILDGGPGINKAGQHKRLSTARKDLLIECSVEQGLTSSAKNGAGTNMTVV